MKKITKELNLIGCYIGYYDGEFFLEDKQQTAKYPFSFETTVVKWEDAYFRPLVVRGIYSSHHFTYRFERIASEEIKSEEVITIDSSVVNNAVIIYKNTSLTDESIQQISVGGLDFIMKDNIGDEEEFYAYYHFAD